MGLPTGKPPKSPESTRLASLPDQDSPAIASKRNRICGRRRSGSWNRRPAAPAATELAMPPAVTLEMAKGFALYMMQAVMNGRTDALIDLAKSNLWR
jgi:hypothetical protein